MSDQISVKVHQNYTMLGLWGSGLNSFQDGDEITEDWILHRDGTKSPLRVKSLSGMVMKAPVLKDLCALEARVYPLLQKLRKKLNLEDPRYDLLENKQVSGVYKNCTYKYTPKDGITQVLWSERKIPIRNKRLLPVLHGIMETLRILSRRLMRLQNLLYGELESEALRRFRDQVRNQQYQSVIMKLNGRNYLLNPASGRVGGFYVAGIVEDLPTVTIG